MRKLTVGSCFSGIGGLELGLEWTGGFETKWQIEIDPYATKVLEKHWPKVKRYSDIRDVVRPECVDLICGGFPCQDVSVAGKRAGLKGRRSTLWKEMFKLIRNVKPRWVVAENVPGLFSSDAGRFFGEILGDLASAGYDVEWGVLSAASVGALHLRRRVFILANASSTRSGSEDRNAFHQGRATGKAGRKSISENAERKDGVAVSNDWAAGEDVAHSSEPRGRGRNQSPGKRAKTAHRSSKMADARSTESRRLPNLKWEEISKAGGSSKDKEMAHTESTRSIPRGLGGSKKETHAEPIERSDISNPELNRLEEPRNCGIPERETSTTPNSNWWTVEPDVGRVAHGVPSRVDRLRCLGNAVVPQVARKIGEMILRQESL